MVGLDWRRNSDHQARQRVKVFQVLSDKVNRSSGACKVVLPQIVKNSLSWVSY